ncbi:fimbrial protein [Enterobacter kobei]|uniref:hypothetical protein n=1 Tax=Enterobacter kobei TaxID=208224 RepID=UPI0004A019B7|nr:hypothetical protein [Enterobacter kobei]KDF41519.1 hypothetical protein AE42_03946 [Enterobacter kobei]
MSFKKVSMGMAIALALSAGSAIAAVPGDTGTITFHGMVSNTTCKDNTQQATVDTSGAAKLYYKVAYTQGQGWDQTTNPVSAGTVQAQVAFTMNYE